MDDLVGYDVGDAVVRLTTRDVLGTVVARRFRSGGEDWYRVRFGAVVRAVLAVDLAPAVQAHTIDELVAQGLYSGHQTVARRLTLAKLRSPLRDAIYSLDAARTEFHPYQFKPLFKFLASERNRVLIADEVGLGKTIEAGYILREQSARTDVDRAVVVCPAALRHKWQAELAGKFGEVFEILTAPDLRAWLVRDDGRRRLRAIVSMQSLRGEAMLDELEARSPSLDLLIVDEAHHHRNASTAQHRAVRQLCLTAGAVVFLTATPLHLGNQDLFALLNLLLPEEFDSLPVFDRRLAVNEHIVRAESALRQATPDRGAVAADHLRRASAAPDPFALATDPTYRRLLDGLPRLDVADPAAVVEARDDLARLNLIGHVLTRTKKRDAIPDAPVRKPFTYQVTFTQAERIAYDTVYDFCAKHYTATAGTWAAQFPLIMLQRQMASSIPAMLEHYADRIDTADTEDDTPDDERPDRITPLTSIPGFRGLITDLLDLPLKRDDTKLSALIHAVGDTGKVVVFSYFRGSLRYVERQLTMAGVACTRIDGGVPYNPANPDLDERQQRIAAFRDPAGPRVLLSSEVGSEGLDFQFCHRLVNWDLPWNPMVVEQRIGRLDRLGQKSPVINIVNFTTPGTIEDRILTRLYKRVGLFEGAIGPLEPILGQAIRELTDDLLRPNLSAEELDELVERKALALEQRKREQERFDAGSAALLGHDDAVRHQIDQVRRLGRYVTPKELRLFVGDHLAMAYPAAGLRDRRDGQGGRDAGPDCHWVRVTADLRTFVTHGARRLDDPPLLQFLERAPVGTDLRVTFDPKAAAAFPAVEHVHNQHPLVRAVAAAMAETPDRVEPVARLSLATDTLDEGDYAFFWADVIEEGLQAGRSIWAEVAEFDGAGRVAAAVAERVLYEMAVEGQPWPDFDPPEPADAAAVVVKFEGWMAERCQARRAAAVEQNQTRVNAKVASLRASTAARRKVVADQVAHHEAAGNARILPAVRGKLAKLDAEAAERERRLVAGRLASVSYDSGGFGYVRVTSPQGERDGLVQ